jgi:hypothetical protein
MKKSPPHNIPEAKAYAVIPGTRYILLPDGILAKPLTSTMKPSGPAFNIVIDGRVRQVSLSVLQESIGTADIRDLIRKD